MALNLVPGAFGLIREAPWAQYKEGFLTVRAVYKDQQGCESHIFFFLEEFNFELDKQLMKGYGDH